MALEKSHVFFEKKTRSPDIFPMKRKVSGIPTKFQPLNTGRFLLNYRLKIKDSKNDIDRKHGTKLDGKLYDAHSWKEIRFPNHHFFRIYVKFRG